MSVEWPVSTHNANPLITGVAVGQDLPCRADQVECIMSLSWMTCGLCTPVIITAKTASICHPWQKQPSLKSGRISQSEQCPLRLKYELSGPENHSFETTGVNVNLRWLNSGPASKTLAHYSANADEQLVCCLHPEVVTMESRWAVAGRGTPY